MPAINTFTPRVKAFQAGGVSDDDSMLFPGMQTPPQQQPIPTTQPPPQAPPAAPPPQPAPALQTSPFLTATDQPQVEINDQDELARAAQEDQKLGQNEVSHLGDGRFYNARPSPRDQTYDYRSDPDYATIQAARQYVNNPPAGTTQAQITAANNIINRKEAALQKTYAGNYKSDYTNWRQQETQRLQQERGEKLTGTNLDNAYGAISTARDAIKDTAADPDKGIIGQKGNDFAYTIGANNPAIMPPSMFNQTALSIAQLNGKPTDMATRYTMQLTAPIGTGQTAFNGRRGAAGANYKVVGRDASGMMVLQTAAGPVVVSPSDLNQIEQTRVRAYNVAKKYAQTQANKPKSRTLGQILTGQ